MASRRFDARALAKAINRRRKEYNRLHPDEPVTVTPSMSRILENDDEYVPYRKRAPRKRHHPVTDPRISTVTEIARRLGTTVGDLLGEPHPPTVSERRRIREFLRYLSEVLDLDEFGR